ncbi:cyclic pyranopterin monophosphate synthase MoaC [Fusibacter paucivorans]|uniref:Cyclic pyranopterin monophosphate synthase n=1 Tax=Fusibacter paucivorans TaxID=76009 RepID=A0ABS5PL36_9FIRM|nr:cyclic pyranopterin monophosphate synthase MoaC [Fusibacter paucivorans]MBS7525893.1 cyclic pyranopterin monophosphate synthase MoaC [Fusibacter paucivorans]
MSEDKHLTHLNADGYARMVSVTDKGDTHRVAIAGGFIRMQPETLDAIGRGEMKKGDVIGVAQVAGIMGAKRTSDVIPMCHPLMLTGVDLDFAMQSDGIEIIATVKTIGKTGVEMEALMAVSTAALTLYDMCKAIDKEMVIERIELLAKRGGKSGDYTKEGYRGKVVGESEGD